MCKNRKSQYKFNLKKTNTCPLAFLQLSSCDSKSHEVKARDSLRQFRLVLDVMSNLFHYVNDLEIINRITSFCNVYVFVV